MQVISTEHEKATEGLAHTSGTISADVAASLPTTSIGMFNQLISNGNAVVLLTNYVRL